MRVPISHAHFHENQHFEPADPKEHEASNEGRDYNGVKTWDLPDCCKHCNHPCNDHFNGRCPK